MGQTKRAILDYSAWIQYSDSYPKAYPSHVWVRTEELGWCPYCRKHAVLSVSEHRTRNYLGAPLSEKVVVGDSRFDYDLDVYECDTCGWWDVHIFQTAPDDWDDCNEVNFRAVLKAYDAVDIDLPVALLRQELLRRHDTVYQIHDRKMEQLVASVLKDFFPGCEVHLCGKTGDQGIDLIVALHDSPIAVQVKRRTKPNSVEAVEAVRAFLGASLIKGFDHLLYVTTADHFTGGPYGAESAAERAIRRKLVKTFELIDRHSFFEMLDLVATGGMRNWIKPLPPIFKNLEVR